MRGDLINFDVRFTHNRGIIVQPANPLFSAVYPYRDSMFSEFFKRGMYVFLCVA